MDVLKGYPEDILTTPHTTQPQQKSDLIPVGAGQSAAEFIVPDQLVASEARILGVPISNLSGTGELHGEVFNELRERDATATR